MEPKFNVKTPHSQCARISIDRIVESGRNISSRTDKCRTRCSDKMHGSCFLSTKPTEVCPNTQYNAGMESQRDIEQRLTDLEVKSTFTEDLVDRLNQEVIRQQRHIDVLVREIRELRQQVAQTDTGTPPGPRDELPPHY